MTNRIEFIYKIIRVIIYFIPAIAVVAGIYLALFPIETFHYVPGQPEISKFQIERESTGKNLNFGAFPIQEHRYVELVISSKQTGKNSCLKEIPQISVQKSYRAFLYPEGNPIQNEEELRAKLFFENKTKFPNGSLLHLKPTDEVYLVSSGKKILFPGPEIFRAFGYSFDNLVEVEKSTLDQFSAADKRVFLWSQPHPDGTVFRSYPSHNLYLIDHGEKRMIENEKIIKAVWPEYFSIAVNDAGSQQALFCKDSSAISDNKLNCLLDTSQIAARIGKYYNFTVHYSDQCNLDDIQIQDAKISFISEKSYSTAKNSLRNIFASIVNRYLNKQNN